MADTEGVHGIEGVTLTAEELAKAIEVATMHRHYERKRADGEQVWETHLADLLAAQRARASYVKAGED